MQNVLVECFIRKNNIVRDLRGGEVVIFVNSQQASFRFNLCPYVRKIMESSVRVSAVANGCFSFYVAL